LSDPELLPIVDCGEPVLRQPAEPVDPADLRTPELQRLIVRMRATMEAAPGVGLAAPQVGVALQLAVLQDGPERWGQLREEERVARERNSLPFTVLVNPTLRPANGDDLVGFYEGCLSVPGITAVVARHPDDTATAWSAESRRRAPPDDAGQQGVEPAHRLGVVRGQVLMAVPQEAQHRDVVLGHHRPQPRRAQGGDGHGERVVGVVLLGLARRQDPHPGRQRRRDVEDLLARTDELLG